jgi:hypothetical protein
LLFHSCPLFNAEELLNLNVSGLGFGGPLPLLGGPITAEAYAVGNIPESSRMFPGADGDALNLLSRMRIFGVAQNV